jgi:hypothetical protein
MDIVIQKGSRIKAAWFQANPIGSSCLAGYQLKTTGRPIEIIGTVKHIRTSADNFNPENNDSVMVFVNPDDNSGEFCSRCGVNEVQIKLKWITEVISL